MPFKTNETLNGTDGRLWINDIPCATIQSFVLHQTNVYEDINKSGSLIGIGYLQPTQTNKQRLRHIVKKTRNSDLFIT